MFPLLIGLVLAALVFGITFILPIVTLSRLKTAASEIESLREKLDRLETEMRRLDRALKDAGSPVPAPASPACTATRRAAAFREAAVHRAGPRNVSIGARSAGAAARSRPGAGARRGNSSGRCRGRAVRRTARIRAC